MSTNVACVATLLSPKSLPMLHVRRHFYLQYQNERIRRRVGSLQHAILVKKRKNKAKHGKGRGDTAWNVGKSPLALRIEWALKCKRICYKYIDEDLLNKSQRLLTHNPIHKKIPVLLHGGKSIPESLVILEYIDETWKQNPLLPEDRYERAMARFWAKFVDENCWTTIPGVFGNEGGDEQEKSKEKAIEELRILEKQLEGKKFFGGESVGFLDIVCGWIAYRLPFIEDTTGLKLVDETSFPALSAWFKGPILAFRG